MKTDISQCTNDISNIMECMIKTYTRATDAAKDDISITLEQTTEAMSQSKISEMRQSVLFREKET